MIPQSAISDLARKICGRILQAGDAAYDAVVKIDNNGAARASSFSHKTTAMWPRP